MAVLARRIAAFSEPGGRQWRRLSPTATIATLPMSFALCKHPKCGVMRCNQRALLGVDWRATYCNLSLLLMHSASRYKKFVYISLMGRRPVGLTHIRSMYRAVQSRQGLTTYGWGNGKKCFETILCEAKVLGDYLYAGFTTSINHSVDSWVGTPRTVISRSASQSRQNSQGSTASSHSQASTASRR